MKTDDEQPGKANGQYTCEFCGDYWSWAPGDFCGECGNRLVITGTPRPAQTKQVWCGECGELMKNPDDGCRNCTREAAEAARADYIDVLAEPAGEETALATSDQRTRAEELAAYFDRREPGIYTQITMEEYHRHPALSKSRLDHLAQSVEHYLEEMRNPTESTPAMVLGTMVHEAVTEPERFKRWQPFSGRRYGHEYDRFCLHVKNLRDSGEVPLAEECSQAFHDTARRVRDRVLKHPVAGPIFEGPGLVESTALVDLKEFPMPEEAPHPFLQGRTRPDKVIDDSRGRFLVDLKTTKCAAADDFSRSMARFRYHVSAAWYSEIWHRAVGWTPESFVLVAAETYPPYPVAVYLVEPSAIRLGREIMMEDVGRLYDALMTPEEDRFLGYNGGDILTIDVPRWEYSRRGQ